MTSRHSVIVLLSTFFTSAMAISGCDTNSLTRRAAEKIITEHFHYPRTTYFYLREGEAKSDWGFDSMYIITEGTDGEFRDRDGFNFDEAMKILSKFDSLGYIQAKKTESLQKSYATIFITRQGKTHFQKAAWKEREQENWWKKPLMKYGVDQITGIALAGDNVTATVEFTMHDYDYDKPLVVLIAPRYLVLNHRARNDAVPMRKYDDGWRIEENRKRR